LFGGDKDVIENARTAHTAAGLALEPRFVDALRARLPFVAEATIEAITAEVPDYVGALTGSMGATIEQAVQTALGAFLGLAGQARDADAGTPLQPALEGAYALGRGEARSGRSMDALLAAYRVGARTSWREMSATAVADGLPAVTVAQFAELVFAYIDQLSAASVAGHTDELATTGRVRQGYLERLGQELLHGQAPVEELVASAQRADWPVPATVTVLLVPSALTRSILPALPEETLALSGDLVGLAPPEPTTVLVVPELSPATRGQLLRRLGRAPAVVGPTRAWPDAPGSYRRAVRTAALLPAGRTGPVDTEEHLAALVLTADREALSDLRTRALAPLAGLRTGSAERLAETLRAWLLHQGRREDVAAHLLVHPQTVRYRMNQVRELFGDRLEDPQTVLELTLALGGDDSGGAGSPAVAPAV
jgi:hypothetical protein